jgi:hypothetical protein
MLEDKPYYIANFGIVKSFINQIQKEKLTKILNILLTWSLSFHIPKERVEIQLSQSSSKLL